jgi:L-asparaginase II
MTDPETNPWGLPGPGGRDPFPVVVRRGGLAESRHAVACVIAAADGRIVRSWGDPDAVVFPRSAIKMLQSLPLVETGAAQAFGCSDAELALACASHSAEPDQVAAVAAWLSRIGATADDLVCGPQWPMGEAAARDLAAAGQRPGRLHNNCSGEHAGMLTTARHLGEPFTGYADPAHPVQQRIVRAVAGMCGVDAAAVPLATDGCSAPALALPLAAIATGLARFGAPATLPSARAAACTALARAMVAQPRMVAGTGRLCTAVNAAAQGRVIVKTGAEGVYAACVPGQGLGIALKALDGGGRAAQVALAAVIDSLGLMDAALRGAIAAVQGPVLSNWAGLAVGRIAVEPSF